MQEETLPNKTRDRECPQQPAPLGWPRFIGFFVAILFTIFGCGTYKFVAIPADLRPAASEPAQVPLDSAHANPLDRLSITATMLPSTATYIEITVNNPPGAVPLIPDMSNVRLTDVGGLTLRCSNYGSESGRNGTHATRYFVGTPPYAWIMKRRSSTENLSLSAGGFPPYVLQLPVRWGDSDDTLTLQYYLIHNPDKLKMNSFEGEARDWRPDEIWPYTGWGRISYSLTPVAQPHTPADVAAVIEYAFFVRCDTACTDSLVVQIESATISLEDDTDSVLARFSNAGVASCAISGHLMIPTDARMIRMQIVATATLSSGLHPADGRYVYAQDILYLPSEVQKRLLAMRGTSDR